MLLSALRIHTIFHSFFFDLLQKQNVKLKKMKKPTEQAMRKIKEKIATSS
jgi:hypothetical protein